MPSDSEALAYFAGVMDSDGWFTAGHSKGIRKSGKPWNHCHARMAIKQVSDEAIRFILETFGGTVSMMDCRHNRLGKRPLFYWSMVSKPELLATLPRLIPYLRIKRRQAEIALSLIRGHIHLAKCSDSERNAEMARRERLHLEMRMVNGGR